MAPEDAAKTLLAKKRAFAAKQKVARLEKQQKGPTGGASESAEVAEETAPSDPAPQVKVAPQGKRRGEALTEGEPVPKRKKTNVRKGPPVNTERALVASPLATRLPEGDDDDVPLILRRGKARQGGGEGEAPTQSDVAAGAPLSQEGSDDDVQVIEAPEGPLFDPVPEVVPSAPPASEGAALSARAGGGEGGQGCRPRDKGVSQGGAPRLVDPRAGVQMNDAAAASFLISSIIPEEVISHLRELPRRDLADLLRLQGLSALFLQHQAASLLEGEEGRFLELESAIARAGEDLAKAIAERDRGRAEETHLLSMVKQANDLAVKHMDLEAKAKLRAKGERKKRKGLETSLAALEKTKAEADVGCSFAERKLGEAKKELGKVTSELDSARTSIELLEKAKAELSGELQAIKASLESLTTEKVAFEEEKVKALAELASFRERTRELEVQLSRLPEEGGP